MEYNPTITPIVFLVGASLLVSAASFFMSLRYWSRSFRPIVTAMVKTHAAGNTGILYDLQIQNSGALPAKNIRLSANQADIVPALGDDSSEENKRRWLSCFEEINTIAILHNNENIRCSFGTSKSNDAGFWKYGATISIVIKYQGWFGRAYTQEQQVKIIDSDSFTGFLWGESNA